MNLNFSMDLKLEIEEEIKNWEKERQRTLTVEELDYIKISKEREKVASMPRILILGADGYIGVALYYYLKSNYYQILGVDNRSRQRNVVGIGSDSLTYNRQPADINIDLSKDYNGLKDLLISYKPDVIVNLAQQPSAPFSMIDAKHAVETQSNNNSTNLNVLYAVKEVNPDIHIIQLGTAGEYPDWLYDGVEIPEGSRIKVQYNKKDWIIPTPRYAGSWYHFSKLHSSYNADYACRIWGLRVSDVNQGIVYGNTGDNRLDYDEYFGTVINRFVVQAVSGIPLTIYGVGGQTRSFIHIKNSVEAIKLMIDNPADKGEYRIIHQLTDVKNINDIAQMIRNITDCEIQYIDNPRAEMPENKFSFEAKKLKTLGLEPVDMETEIRNLIDIVKKYKDNIRTEVILPKTKWK